MQDTTKQQAPLPFMYLSADECERLAVLAEDCALTVSAIGIILRHGLTREARDHFDGVLKQLRMSARPLLMSLPRDMYQLVAPPEWSAWAAEEAPKIVEDLQRKRGPERIELVQAALTGAMMRAKVQLKGE